MSTPRQNSAQYRILSQKTGPRGVGGKPPVETKEMQTKINCLIFHAALGVSYQRRRLTKRVLARCTCHRRGISISFPLWPHKPVSRRSFAEIHDVETQGDTSHRHANAWECTFFFLSCRPPSPSTRFGFPATFTLYTAALVASSKKTQQNYVTHSLKNGSGKSQFCHE